MFRVSTRTLTFPDNVTRDVEAFRLIWTWFDRSIAYEFGFDQSAILQLALECSEQEGLPLGQAIGKVLEHTVSKMEKGGADFTDENLALAGAKRGLEAFKKRKG